MNHNTHSWAYGPLESISVIQFEGPDSADFLHAQLTSDVKALAKGATQPAALLNPKGRVSGVGALNRSGDDRFGWFVDQPIAETLAQRLTMFRFRAKLEIQASSQPVFAVTTGPVPYLDGSRFLANEGDSSAPAVDTEWLTQDIDIGIPRLSPETQDAFTAHSLRLNHLQALSYDKGCYPGQEVVARTRHLGRGKRHAYRLTSNQPLSAHDEVLSDRGALGRVVMGAPQDRQWTAMAVLHESAESNPLTLASGAEVVIQHRY